MTPDELGEIVAQEAIEKIERDSLEEGMNVSDAAKICRDVAGALRNRAEMFDSETDGE